MGLGKGGSILIHVETNNAEREDTKAIVKKYRQLVRRANTLVQLLSGEEEVGFVDLRMLCWEG